MTSDRPLAALAVAAMLLLAGCAGITGGDGTAKPTETATVDDGTPVAETTTASTPSETSTPTATATPTDGERPTATATTTSTATETPADGPDVGLEGGDLAVDEDRVYAQVQELLGVEAPPPTVYVTDEMETLQRYEEALAHEFHYAFGFGDDFIRQDVYHGAASPQRITVMPKNASESQQEMLLAHEYVHWLQFHTDAYDTEQLRLNPDDTDAMHTRAGLVEGGSVFVTDEYVATYMEDSPNQTEELREQYEAGPPARRIFRARYVYGATYIHGQVDGATNLSDVYSGESPTPETTEQLIHGYASEDGPPANLSLAVDDGGNWTERPQYRDTKGELVVRTMFRVEFDESTAAPAADGWGNDRIARFDHAENENRTGFAWALRWDDESHADEFEDAFADWIDARDDANATYRQERFDAETVVVLAGDDAFVDAASVSGDGETVNVTTAP